MSLSGTFFIQSSSQSKFKCSTIVQQRGAQRYNSPKEPAMSQEKIEFKSLQSKSHLEQSKIINSLRV